MAELTLPITGGCLRRAIRYEVDGSPELAVMCHCRMCQKWSGSPASGGVVFARADFRFTKGTPKIYQSSAIAERIFCPDCGSPLILHYLVPPYGPDKYFVKIGSLDSPEAFALEEHFGVEGHLSSWVPLSDELPRTRCDEDDGLAAAWVAAGRHKK